MEFTVALVEEHEAARRQSPKDAERTEKGVGMDIGWKTELGAAEGTELSHSGARTGCVPPPIDLYGQALEDVRKEFPVTGAATVGRGPLSTDC